MNTETTLFCTKEARFKVGDEIVEIERFGENDYSVYLKNGDCSARGTYLDIIKELLEFGPKLASAVPLPGEGMTVYRLFYEERGIRELQVKDVEGTDLDDALCRFARTCMKEDHTGIFFPLADADLEDLKNKPGFHALEVDGEHLGIILVDHAAVAPAA